MMPKLGDCYNCGNDYSVDCENQPDCFLKRYNNTEHIKIALESLKNFDMKECKRELEHLLNDAEQYCDKHNPRRKS
jgi:hypothetical protein